MSKATSKDNNTGVPQGRKPEDEMRGLEPSAPTENSLRCANCPKEGMTRKEYVEHWNRNHGSGEVTQTDSSVDEYQAQAESLTEQWMETLAPLDKVCVASHGRLDVMIADALRASYADERLEACRLVGEQDPEMVYGTHAAIQRLGEELHRLASTAPAATPLAEHHPVEDPSAAFERWCLEYFGKRPADVRLNPDRGPFIMGDIIAAFLWALKARPDCKHDLEATGRFGKEWQCLCCGHVAWTKASIDEVKFFPENMNDPECERLRKAGLEHHFTSQDRQAKFTDSVKLPATDVIKSMDAVHEHLCSNTGKPWDTCDCAQGFQGIKNEQDGCGLPGCRNNMGHVAGVGCLK